MESFNDQTNFKLLQKKQGAKATKNKSLIILFSYSLIRKSLIFKDYFPLSLITEECFEKFIEGCLLEGGLQHNK